MSLSDLDQSSKLECADPPIPVPDDNHNESSVGTLPHDQLPSSRGLGDIGNIMQSMFGVANQVASQNENIGNVVGSFLNVMSQNASGRNSENIPSMVEPLLSQTKTNNSDDIGNDAQVPKPVVSEEVKCEVQSQSQPQVDLVNIIQSLLGVLSKSGVAPEDMTSKMKSVLPGLVTQSKSESSSGLCEWMPVIMAVLPLLTNLLNKFITPTSGCPVPADQLKELKLYLPQILNALKRHNCEEAMRTLERQQKQKDETTEIIAGVIDTCSEIMTSAKYMDDKMQAICFMDKQFAMQKAMFKVVSGFIGDDKYLKLKMKLCNKAMSEQFMNVMKQLNK